VTLDLLRNIIKEILAEEVLGLHGTGLGEKDLASSLSYGSIELNEDGSVTDDEAVLREFIRGSLQEYASPSTVNEMLTVRTMVAPSQIEGEGLYAAEFIPKGKIVSRWVEGSDKTFSNEYADELPAEEQKCFKELASWDGDSWFLSGDDAVYFNHSKSPNVRVVMGRGSPATWDRVATRDIQPGEELTMDYREIGLDPILPHYALSVEEYRIKKV